MYDTFSSDYDRFVSWPGRLNTELPLLQRVLDGAGASTGQAPRVLDVACGTGMHVIELAWRGYSVSGADNSAGMIARARANAKAAGMGVDFFLAGFGDLQRAVLGSGASSGFDGILCLGNSLPHVADRAQLEMALRDFSACLRHGGVAVIQNRNFDAVMAHHERWMEPQSHREGEQEWLFLRFYDYRPDGKIDFNILSLKRSAQEAWQQQVMTTTLYPILQTELADLLARVGFTRIEWFGSMAGEPFTARTSGNLVVVAYKA